MLLAEGEDFRDLVDIVRVHPYEDVLWNGVILWVLGRPWETCAGDPDLVHVKLMCVWERMVTGSKSKRYPRSNNMNRVGRTALAGLLAGL